MRVPETAAKIWYLVIAYYLVPLILSIVYILNTNRFLGDFTFSLLTDGYADVIVAGAIYLLPLVCIILILRVADWVHIGNCKKDAASYFYGMLITVTILAIIFGLPTIGEAGGGGISGFVQTIMLKFNPYLVFLLFAFSNASTRRLIIGSLCLAVIGYEQKSLLPALMLVMAISVHYVSNNPVSWLKLITYTLIIVITAFNVDTLLADLYQLRNELRGSDAEVTFELVKHYALGRITSFSSLYYIWSGNCCTESPDMFYVLGTVLERFSGLQLSTLGPSQIFSRELLGSDAVDYGIFTSFAGSLIIEARASLSTHIISILSYCVFIVIAYKITPLPRTKEKVPFFLLLFYFPYLSGDVWEFSILIQSLAVITVTIFALKRITYQLNDRHWKRFSFRKGRQPGGV